ncbi:MAG: transposase, IS4 family protein, partial [Elusimicrobia bacterium]
DHSGHIPSFLIVTDGKMHEIVVAKESFPIIPDSITCFDKGYIDYGWLRRITDGGAYFVTRAKENLHASFLGQQERPRGKGDKLRSYVAKARANEELKRLGLSI